MPEINVVQPTAMGILGAVLTLILFLAPLVVSYLNRERRDAKRLADSAEKLAKDEAKRRKKLTERNDELDKKRKAADEWSRTP